MTNGNGPKYQMTLSLNVLNHLGIGLYSNVPAVLSEAVANAWDADAENVIITIDRDKKTITIEDDGHGMNVDDVNKKYLHVGYKRRGALNGAVTSRFRRPVMGRKGIGKLSLFSIANLIEVHSVKDSEFHGFVMDLRQIKDAIKDGNEKKYEPAAISPEKIEINRGTRIILSKLNRQLKSDKWLKRRLARRFSIIGSLHHFDIVLNDEPITIDDRDYFDKLQYIWTYGEKSNAILPLANNQIHNEHRPGLIKQDQNNKSLKIEGWIGTAEQAGQLKDSETGESLNKIVVMVRGKLAQEDILEEFGEGGMYSKYIIGEIHADFLDDDNKEDIATTSRQKIIEEDTRYLDLKEKLRHELKYIQNQWTDLRNAGGRKKAIRIPQINKWFSDLNPDHKKAAEKLFGRIYQLPIDDLDELRQLLIGSILAFESLRLRNLLYRLEDISVDNLSLLNEIFVQLNDLEASSYYQISKERLEVIKILGNLIDENALEKAFQIHLFEHLWLLDPSWERATNTVVMEKPIARALQEVYSSLTPEERNNRVDISYSTTANKHVIIELKRASRTLNSDDIYTQIRKYRTAAKKVLKKMRKENEPLEFICVVGKEPSDWKDTPGGEKDFRKTLDAIDARIVMYDELINNAREAYKDYLNREEEAGRVHRLIMSINTEDMKAMSP